MDTRDLARVYAVHNVHNGPLYRLISVSKTPKTRD